MNTTKNTLAVLIVVSSLLTPKRKKSLLDVLPGLNEEKSQELFAILSSETDIIRDISREAVKQAVQAGDEKFLQEFDNFLHVSLRALRKEEEKAERKGDEKNLEHLFHRLQLLLRLDNGLLYLIRNDSLVHKTKDRNGFPSFQYLIRQLVSVMNAQER